MVSDRQLRRWYREYNRRYFGDELPHDAVIYYATVVRAYGDCGLEKDGRFHIRINPDKAWGRCERKFTVLHEMAHIRTWPRLTHGPYFYAEMLRLANAGAMKGLW